jgi:hypothetical protein
VWSCGNKQWWFEGKVHRDGGLPAIERVNGHNEWWLEGKIQRKSF